MDPVGKSKIDPEAVKKAVRKIFSVKKQAASAKRKVDRDLFVNQLAGMIIRDEIEQAKKNFALIDLVRERIVGFSKKSRLPRCALADISVLAICAYVDTVYKEALRPQRKSSKK